MDAEYLKVSVEALAMLGADYRNVELPVMDMPWHLMAELCPHLKKNSDQHKFSGMCPEQFGDSLSVEEGHHVGKPLHLIEYNGCKEDPDCMKLKLKEWVAAVVDQVRYLLECSVTRTLPECPFENFTKPSQEEKSTSEGKTIQTCLYMCCH